MTKNKDRPQYKPQKKSSIPAPAYKKCQSHFQLKWPLQGPSYSLSFRKDAPGVG